MFISFASCFRRRPSGTGKNEPPTSLCPAKGSRPESRGGGFRAIPPSDASHPSCGPKGGDGYLIN